MKCLSLTDSQIFEIAGEIAMAVNPEMALENLTNIIPDIAKTFGEDYKAIDWRNEVALEVQLIMDEVLGDLSPTLDIIQNTIEETIVLNVSGLDEVMKEEGEYEELQTTTSAMTPEFKAPKKSFQNIMKTFFKDYTEQINLVEATFRNKMYSAVQVDFKGDYILDPRDAYTTDFMISSFKQTIEDSIDPEMQDLIENSDNVEELLLSSPKAMETYTNLVILNNFDTLLSHYTNGNFEFKDGEYVHQNLVKMDTGWETKDDSDFPDAFSAVSTDIMYHLDNTPEMEYDEKTDSFKVSKDTTHVIQRKRALASARFHLISNDAASIREAVRQQMLSGDKVFTGLWARFFSPQPVIVDGEEQHSFSSMQSNPDVTKDILSGVSHSLINLAKKEYVFGVFNADGEYMLDIPTHESSTRGQLMNNLSKKAPTSAQNLIVDRKNKTIMVNGSRFSYANKEASDSLKTPTYVDLFSHLGITLPVPNTANFINAFIARYGKKGLDRLIVDVAMSQNANNVIYTKPDKEAAIREYFTTTLNATDERIEKILEMYRENGVVGADYAIVSVGTVANMVNDIHNANSDKTTHRATGNQMVTYGVMSAAEQLEAKINRQKFLGDAAINRNNAFVKDGGDRELERILVKGGDQVDGQMKDHKKMKAEAELARSSLLMFGAQIRDTDGTSAIIEILTPADKPRYHQYQVKLKEGSYIPLNPKTGRLDRQALIQQYWGTVAQQWRDNAEDIQSNWTKILTELGHEVPEDLDFVKFAEHVEKLNLSIGDIEQTRLVNDVDYVKGHNGVIIRPDLIEYYKIHSSRDLTRKFLEYNLKRFAETITEGGKSRTGLFQDDKGFNILKDKNGRPAPLSPKMLQWFEDKFKYDKFEDKDGNQILKYNDKSKNTIYHPLIESFFFAQVTNANQLLKLHMGTPMTYKFSGELDIMSDVKKEGTTEYFEKLNFLTHTPYIDMGKRSVALVSTVQRMVLGAVNKDTGLVDEESSHLLPTESKVAYFKDTPYRVSVLSTGEQKYQETNDGASWQSEMDLIFMNNSYGGRFSSLREATIVKDFNPAIDERGIAKTEKKATFPLTSEIQRLTQSSNKMINEGKKNINLQQLVEKSLSIPFKLMVTDKKYGISKRYNSVYEMLADGLTIDQAKEILLDPDIGYAETIGEEATAAIAAMAEGSPDVLLRPIIKSELVPEAAYEDMFDLYLALDGDNNPDIWKNLVQLQIDNPQIHGQYISKLTFDSAVKSGVNNLNESIYDSSNNDETLRYENVSNRDAGIQLNADHDPYHVKDGLSMVTQLIGSLILEGNSTGDVNNVYDAISKLGEHKMDRDIRNEKDLTRFVKNLIIQDAGKGMVTEDVVQAVSDPNWSLDDPTVRDIAFSKLKTFIEKRAIRHKFSGGQFVVTSLNDMAMVYEVPGVGTMHRIEFDNYLANNGLNEDQVEHTVRNLKGPDYTREIEVDGKTITESIRDRAEFAALIEARQEVQQYRKLFSQYEKSDVSQERRDVEDTLRAAEARYNDVRTIYRNLLEKGGWKGHAMEVMLPSVFKNYFTGPKVNPFEEDININEIKQDPMFFIDVAKARLGLNPIPEGEVVESTVEQEARTITEKEAIVLAKELHDSFFRLLELNGARIPGSGKQSSFPMKVVGFVESLRNAVVIPPDSMVIKGEDLDIDKSNLHMYEPLETGLHKGMTVPFYTVVEGSVVKNIPGGTLATLEQIQGSKYADEFNTYQLETGKSQDVYEAGIKNYILASTNKVLKAPINAIEVNTPVSMDRSEDFIKTLLPKMLYSAENPASLTSLSKENKDGADMIAVEAVAMKAYQAYYAAAINMPDRKDSGGFKLGRVVYDKLANVDQGFEQAWEAYSELINAATDNAKHLILSKLNLNEDTASFTNYLLAYGVPMDTVMDILQDPILPNILDGSDRSIPDSVFNEKYGTDIDKIRKKSKQFSLVGRVLGINQGLKTDIPSMYNLANDIQRLGIWDLLDQDNLKDLDVIGGIPSDPTAILKFNPHYFTMLKSAKQFINLVEKLTPSLAVVNETSQEIALKDKMDDSDVNQNDPFYFNHTKRLLDNIVSEQHLKGKIVTAMGNQVNLSTAADRTRFVREFSKEISEMKGTTMWNQNAFINTLLRTPKKLIVGAKSINTETYATIGLRNKDENEILKLKLAYESLPLDMKEKFFYYDLITNGGTGSYSYNKIIDLDTKRPLMISRKQMNLRGIDRGSLVHFADITNSRGLVDNGMSREEYYELQGDIDEGFDPPRKVVVEELDPVTDSPIKTIIINNEEYRADKYYALFESGINFEVINGTVLHDARTRDMQDSPDLRKSVNSAYSGDNQSKDPIIRPTQFKSGSTTVKYVSSNQALPGGKGTIAIVSPNGMAELSSIEEFPSITDATGKKIDYKKEIKIRKTFDTNIPYFEDKKGIRYVLPHVYQKNEKIVRFLMANDKDNKWAEPTKIFVEGYMTKDGVIPPNIKTVVMIEDSITNDGKENKNFRIPMVENGEVVVSSKRAFNYRTPTKIDSNERLQNGFKEQGFRFESQKGILIEMGLNVLNQIEGIDVISTMSNKLPEFRDNMSASNSKILPKSSLSFILDRKKRGKKGQIPSSYGKAKAFNHNGTSYINSDNLDFESSVWELLPVFAASDLELSRKIVKLPVMADIMKEIDEAHVEMPLGDRKIQAVATMMARNIPNKLGDRTMIGDYNEIYNDVLLKTGIGVNVSSVGDLVNSMRDTANFTGTINQKFNTIFDGVTDVDQALNEIKQVNKDNIKDNNEC